MDAEFFCQRSAVTRTRRSCTPGSPFGCWLFVYWAGRRACASYGLCYFKINRNRRGCWPL